MAVPANRRRSAVGPTPPKRRVGRPARVSTQIIVAAAIEIGLERATCKLVADHLGVSVATLYRHVGSNEELVRLAATQVAASRRFSERTEVHWSELATRYAEVIYDSVVAQPGLVPELMKGRLGPDVEVELLEQFLGALEKQGFGAVEGLQLRSALGMLALGGAVSTIAANAGEQSGTPWGLAMRRTLAERDDRELPVVRRVFPEYLKLHPSHQWRRVLRVLLSGVAKARGERLPVQDAPVSKPEGAARKRS
jgi:AcrR family transcriptional regulator